MHVLTGIIIRSYCAIKVASTYYYDLSDRFSRKVIWLEVCSTNKDPRVIARYYLEATESINGI